MKSSEKSREVEAGAIPSAPGITTPVQNAQENTFTQDTAAGEATCRHRPSSRAGA